MYFPLSWPKQLIAQNDDSPLVSVSASYDHFLFAVLTRSTVGIWFCKVNWTSLQCNFSGWSETQKCIMECGGWVMCSVLWLLS